MQVVINSNKASRVQNTLTQKGVEDLSYDTNPSFPNLSKRMTEVSPYIGFGGAPDNASHTINIPKSNLWYLGRLKFTYITTLAAGDITALVGQNIIRNLQFVCNGQPFAEFSGEAIKMLIQDSPKDFQDHCNYYSYPLTSTEALATVTEASGTYISYLPLFGSWFENIQKALDCSYVEQIQLVITYKTYTEAGLSAQMSSLNTVVQTYKYLPDPETYNKILAENRLNNTLECYNTFTERQVLTGSVSSPQIFTSSIFYPCYKTHLFIAKTNTNGTAPILGCPQLRISSVSVDIGGENLYTSMLKSAINYEQAVRKMSSFSLSNAGVPSFNLKQAVTIDWSLLCDRKSNSGLASMANLSRPQFTVNIADTLGTGAAIGDYTLFLVHEYWNILVIDPETRIISVEASH